LKSCTAPYLYARPLSCLPLLTKQACDQVLNSVETYLTGFQSDLGAVSNEIESLQSRSAAMNSKLENRRVVEKLLGPAVEDLGLSPAVVRKIADGPMDESWTRALAELEKRKKAVQARAKDPKKIKAVDDMAPLLDNLTNKVCLCRYRLV
jgi:vacuolar protein sorting-associated protein 52